MIVQGATSVIDNNYINTRKAVDSVNNLNRADDAKLKESCEQFEALFIKMMLDSMKKTVNKSGLLDGGMSEDIFEDMLYDEYAQKMSKSSSFGIAKSLYNQLSPESLF